MRYRLFACLVLSGAAPARGAAAVPIDRIVALYGPTYELAIRREGSVIGHHTLTFRQEGGTWQVAAASDVAIKLAFIALFRFTYRSDETWADNRLTALTADTDDDGERTRVAVRAAATGFRITGSGGDWVGPPASFPTSHWQRPAPGPGVVINTLTGKRNDVVVVDRGEETLDTGAGPIKARRLSYTGDLEVDTWYEADGRWLGMRFKGRDGAPIDYICTRCGR